MRGHETAEQSWSPGLPEALFVPDTLDLTFRGFTPEAFEILDRLKANPHIGQYRAEKDNIQNYLTGPFKSYRDDIVVNLVLPNGLNLETERNVFSRLLKNDFGAGGCHHHLWMSFYRPGYTRLKDIQLPHSIDPEGLSVGLYIGSNAPAILREAHRRMSTRHLEVSELVNDLLAKPRWRFSYYLGSGASEERRDVEGVINEMPSGLEKATGFWFRKHFGREEVVDLGRGLAPHTLRAMQDIWPLYLFFTENGRYQGAIG